MTMNNNMNSNDSIIKVNKDGTVQVFLHEPEHVAQIGLLAHKYYCDAVLYEGIVDYIEHCIKTGVDVTKLAAPEMTFKETLKIRVAATLDQFRSD